MSESFRAEAGTVFEVLAVGLAPFVDRRMRASYPDDDWILVAASKLGKREDVLVSLSDPHFQLEVLNRFWGPVFAPVLDERMRTVIGELRVARNHWAHIDEDHPMDLEYARRVHDLAEDLLRAAEAPEAADVSRLADALELEAAHRRSRGTGGDERDGLLAELAELRHERDAMEAQLTRAREEVSAAGGRTRAVSRQLAELQTQYAAVAGLQRRYADVQSQLEALGRSLGDVDAASDAADREVGESTKDVAATVASLADQAARLQGELRAARAALDSGDVYQTESGRRLLYLMTALVLVFALAFVTIVNMA